MRTLAYVTAAFAVLFVAGCGDDDFGHQDLANVSLDLSAVVQDMTTSGGDMATVGDMAMAAADGPQTVTVNVAPNGNLVFDPASVTIHVGDTVHWVWASSGHTVTSGTAPTPDNKFCSPNDTNCATASTSSAGATYDHTFPTAGSFPYFCLPHGLAGMQGTITVQ